MSRFLTQEVRKLKSHTVLYLISYGTAKYMGPDCDASSSKRMGAIQEVWAGPHTKYATFFIRYNILESFDFNFVLIDLPGTVLTVLYRRRFRLRDYEI